MTKKQLRIALSSQPFSGHLNPLVILAEELATRKNENKDNEVFVVTLPYGAKKIESKCNALGIRVVGLSVEGEEQFESEEALKQWARPNIVFPRTADSLENSVQRALDDIRPDVIVSDFCDLGSQRYAASRNIPLIINWPGPFSTLRDLTRPVIDGGSNGFYFAGGGFYFSYIRFDLVRFLMCFNVNDLGRLADGIQKSVTCGNSMVLVHSFWGLEQPNYLLYPNIVGIGPIDKAPFNASIFFQSHRDVHTFLHSSRGTNRKIILVSTGTLIKMEKWMVQLLWNAFEILSRERNVSIIWSLQEAQQDFLSKEQLLHPAFYFSTWLPQPALLASDLVDGVVTHCGWNGTTECILGGKPVVVLPFFADQMTNARLLLNAGCATSVAKLPIFNLDSTGHSAYAKATNDDLDWWDLKERLRRFPKSKLCVERVVAACQRVLEDPSYKRAAERLQVLSSAPGKGRDYACDLIEHAGHHGLWHLTESGNGGNDNLSRVGRNSRRLTGHRPLLITLVVGAFLIWVLTGVFSITRRTIMIIDRENDPEF